MKSKKIKKRRALLLSILGAIVIGILIYILFFRSNDPTVHESETQDSESASSQPSEDESSPAGTGQSASASIPLLTANLANRLPYLGTPGSTTIPVVHSDDYLIRKQFERGEYPSDACRYAVMREKDSIDFLNPTKTESWKKEKLYKFFRDTCYPQEEPAVLDGNI